MELSNCHRAIISRGTLLVVSIALIYSGGRVFGKANELHAEWVDRQSTLRANGVSVAHQREASGAPHLWLAGALLLTGGAIAGTLAVVPTQWLTRISVAPVTGKAFD